MHFNDLQNYFGSADILAVFSRMGEEEKDALGIMNLCCDVARCEKASFPCESCNPILESKSFALGQFCTCTQGP